MGSVNASVRLRPIRFAFLVRPDDAKNTQKIFRINTCLWGGKFNPIIPCFKRLPTWWERKGFKFENARQVLNGYIDFFEPDFLVEAEKGLSDGLGFDAERVLRLTDLLGDGGDRDWEKKGFSVNELYRHLYETEFKFERRHPHNIVHVEAADKRFESLATCLFGGFPQDRRLKFIERNYVDVTSPEKIALDANELDRIYRNGCTSPLKLGTAEIDVVYHDRQDPALFIIDAQKARDLIDFWNLRAIRRDVLAVPIQWISELSAFCKDFILENYRPLPGNKNGVMIRPTCMFSRSIPEADIEDIHKKYLQVKKREANVIQTWYPSFWRAAPEIMVRTMRPTLDAETKRVEGLVADERPVLQFDSLSPEFASDYGGQTRWANVVRMQDLSFKDQIATVFPTNCRTESSSKFRLGGEHLLSTTEGLVVFPRYKGLPERWEIVDGATAFRDWLKESAVKAKLSDAGRATQQIIQTLGGFNGVGSLAKKGIIELLNDLSKKPVTHSAHCSEFQNKVKKAVGKDIWTNRNADELVKRKAVELGLELKCEKCGSWSWHAVNDLDYSLVCNLCLQEFDFPIARPGDSGYTKWAYRVIGPFALPDYAKGGYAAALSIRFFASVLGSRDCRVTWSGGQELSLPDGKTIEADFILWSQRKQLFGNDYPTQVVFGEAKSFGREVFKDQDIANMKRLSQSFPGSILVFSTMKEASDFSKEELTRLSKLAEWGREYDKDRKQTRAPVIILTGTELFSSFSLSHTWKEKGGRHKKLIEPASVRTENLLVLADLTQQLYLDIPSYHSWLDQKWKKRAARRKRNAA